MKEKELLNIIAQEIYDKKGFNILALDIRMISNFTDYVLIAEGNVDRHVKSIAESIMGKVEQPCYHVEGLESGDWIVLDYISIIVHLFTPGLREKYQLEDLWNEGKIIPLDIKTEKP